MKFYGAAHGTTVEGPTLLHVGERSVDDKKFATDEFVLAPPGTVVAPRPHGMEATPQNAALALIDQADGTDIIDGKTMRLLQNTIDMHGAHDGAAVAEVAPGAQSMAELLSQLVQDGGMSIDMLLGIFSLFESMGLIIPEAVGVTDVADLRDIIGGATGGNTPTLGARQFGETQRINNANIMAQLGVIIPGLLGKTGTSFDAGLAQALDPGLRNATGNFQGGTGNITEIGKAVRDVQPLETLAKQQQTFNQALSGFRSFGLGRPRPSVSPTAGV